MSNDPADNKEQSTAKICFTYPTFLVLSGFSGTGKTTIRYQLLKEIPGSRFSLSVTTRKRRQEERDGVDYRFITQVEFDNLAANNELIEWEIVHGYCYGTPLKPVEDAHKTPGLIIFDLDVHGGLSIKKRYADAILVFLNPPSYDVLRERLTKRLADSPEEIERRMQRIPKEEDMSKQYDFIVTNTTVEQTVNEVCGILRDFQKQ